MGDGRGIELIIIKEYQGKQNSQLFEDTTINQLFVLEHLCRKYDKKVLFHIYILEMVYFIQGLFYCMILCKMIIGNRSRPFVTNRE